MSLAHTNSINSSFISTVDHLPSDIVRSLWLLQSINIKISKLEDKLAELLTDADKGKLPDDVRQKYIQLNNKITYLKSEAIAESSALQNQLVAHKLSLKSETDQLVDLKEKIKNTDQSKYANKELREKLRVHYEGNPLVSQREALKERDMVQINEKSHKVILKLPKPMKHQKPVKSPTPMKIKSPVSPKSPPFVARVEKIKSPVASRAPPPLRSLRSPVIPIAPPAPAPTPVSALKHEAPFSRPRSQRSSPRSSSRLQTRISETLSRHEKPQSRTSTRPQSSARTQSRVSSRPQSSARPSSARVLKRPLSLSPEPEPQPQADPEETEKYCFCKQISFGNMIACDNEESCPNGEWFHYKCVGLQNRVEALKYTTGKEKWFCSQFCKARYNEGTPKPKKKKRRRW